MFVYDGLSINSVSMAGNRYLNFVLVVLIEIPGALVTAKLMQLFGRRASLSGSFVLAALCCLGFHFLPAGTLLRYTHAQTPRLRCDVCTKQGRILTHPTNKSVSTM